VKSLASASIVVDAAKHPRVGILFDPAHFHCTPSKLEHLTPHVVSQILHVHVDDMNATPGDLANCNADRALPGQGTLDLKTIFGRIEEHGYRGFFSIEMFSEELWALPVSEAARRCFQSMQTLL
jgi:2-keto-myo-inositol isomerase